MFALPVVLAGAIASTPMNADVPGGLYMRSDGVGKMVPVPHEVAHRGSFIEMYSPKSESWSTVTSMNYGFVQFVCNVKRTF